MENLPKLIVIVGPTASGKTDLGIALAKRFNGEVISADSRLVYTGMNIGTAKPEGAWRIGTLDEMRGKIGALFGGGARVFEVEGVPHWGIDLITPDREFSVAEYKSYCEDRIRDILRRDKLPIIVGGTGLWIDAVVDNLSIPEVPPNPAIRAELEPRALDDLFAEFKRLDPIGAEVIDRHNKRRLVRALEVCRVTGKPFSAQQLKGNPKYDVLKIGPDVSKEELDRRIDSRVEKMIATGLVDEVRGLMKTYGLNDTAMTGIGYRQVAFFLNGKANLAAVIDDIKRDTRAYAKRQMTWFKRDERIKWVKGVEEVEKLVETFL